MGITRIDNRVYRLLTGGSRVGWAAVGRGIATSSIVYAALLIAPKRVIFTSAWAAFAVGCAAAGWVAARLTNRALHSSSYQILRLTALPAAEVVLGFVWAALHRLRFLLGWLVGIAPLLILTPYLYATQGAAQRCFAYVSRRNWAKVVHEFGFTRVYRLPEPVRCVAPSDARLAGSALTKSPVPVALGCLLLLMVTLGVTWALARSHPSIWPGIGLAALSIGVLLAAGYARLLKPALQAPVFCQTQCTYILPWPPDLPFETILLVMYLLAAWGVQRLARRWVE